MTTNKLAQVVIGNWVLVMGVVIGKALQMLFLGRLRDNEVEVRFIFYPPAPLKINVCLKRTVTKSVVSCTKCRILCTSISFRLFPALCCWRKGVVAGFLPVYRQYIVALGYTLCFSNTANSEGRTGVCSPFGPCLGSPPKNASKYVWKSPTKSVWEDVCFQRLGSLGGVQSHTPQCTGTGAAE